MTDSDDTLTDGIDTEALRDVVPTDRLRTALDADDAPFPGGVSDAVPDRIATGESQTAVAAAGLGFDGLVYAVGRYLPVYLSALGAGSIAIGLVGTVALALPPLYGGRWPRSLADRSGVLVPIVAGVGLLAWLFAPAVDVPLSGWTLVLAGLPLVGIPLAVRDTAPVVPRPDALTVSPGSDGFDHLIATGGGVALVAGLVAAAGNITAALRIALALAVVAALTLVTLRAVCEDTDRLPAPRREPDRETDVSGSEGRSWRDALASLAALSPDARAALAGDALVRAAVGAVSVFVVVVVTDALALEASLLGHQIGPNAVFGGLVVVEFAGAALARSVRRVDLPLGRRPRLLVGGALAVAFPLLLVSVPSVPLVVAVLFGGFGFRAVGGDACRELGAAALDGTPIDVDRYVALRGLAIAPSALLGGVLYATSPTLAFGTATAVGAVGVRELWRSRT